jgi:uncharacterized protein
MRLASILGLVLLAACGGGGEGEGPAPASAPSPASAPTATLEGPIPTSPEPGRIELRTGDGARLAGTLRSGGPTAVVLAHMSGRSEEDWAPVAEQLSAEGFTVVTFDFRGHGRSPGAPAPASAPVDLRAAVRFAQERGAERLVLVGASLGGMAVAKVAGEVGADGVAIVSAPFSFAGLDVLPGDLEALPGEKLFVVAEGDAVAADVQEMYRIAQEPKRLEMLAGSAHGTEILASTDGERLRALVLELATG